MIPAHARVAAAWRRLFGPRAPSPALETFLGWLAATPYVWRVRPDGKLRAYDRGAELCAITAVARHRTGRIHGVGDWVRAGDRLGLSYTDAGLVVDAADARSTSGRVRWLRTRLLVAARLAAPAPRPPQDILARQGRGARCRRRDRPAWRRLRICVGAWGVSWQRSCSSSRSPFRSPLRSRARLQRGRRPDGAHARRRSAVS